MEQSAVFGKYNRPVANHQLETVMLSMKNLRREPDEYLGNGEFGRGELTTFELVDSVLSYRGDLYPVDKLTVARDGTIELTGNISMPVEGLYSKDYSLQVRTNMFGTVFVTLGYNGQKIYSDYTSEASTKHIMSSVDLLSAFAVPFHWLLMLLCEISKHHFYN